MTLFREQKGFGFIEVIIASSILTLAILTTAFSIWNLQDLGELSREKTAAVTDANRVLEAMRDTANTSLDTLRTTNWTIWAQNNVMNTKGANEVLLNGENIMADVEPAGNPAPVTLTVNWNHRQRPYQHMVMTLMTDRNG